MSDYIINSSIYTYINIKSIAQKNIYIKKIINEKNKIK